MESKCENLNISCYRAKCDSSFVIPGCVYDWSQDTCNSGCGSTKCMFGAFSLINLTSNTTQPIKKTYFCPTQAVVQQNDLWMVIGILLAITVALVIIFVLLNSSCRCNCQDTSSKFNGLGSKIKDVFARPKNAQQKRAKQESLLIELVDEQFKQPEKYV